MWQDPKEEKRNERHAESAGGKQEQEISGAPWKDVLGEDGEEECAETECCQWKGRGSSTVVRDRKSVV